jgi:Tfp pilus assembly protein PilF
MKFLAIAAVILLTVLLAGCGSKSGPAPCSLAERPLPEAGERESACREADAAFISGMPASAAPGLAEIGFDYLEKGDYRTALERFNQAWLLDGGDCGARAGFAAVRLLHDGDLAASQAHYREAVELCPDRPDVKAGYGLLLERADQPERAIAALEQSLLLAPANAEAWKALIRCHVRVSAPETTLAAVERAAANGVPTDRRLVEELRRRAAQRR